MKVTPRPRDSKMPYNLSLMQSVISCSLRHAIVIFQLYFCFHVVLYKVQRNALLYLIKNNSDT